MWSLSRPQDVVGSTTIQLCHLTGIRRRLFAKSPTALQPRTALQPCDLPLNSMGNSVSNQAPAAEPKPVAGTTLWGSWDKPVAGAYVAKQQQSKSAKAATKGAVAKGAAGAAPGSSVELEAGAGLNLAASNKELGLKPAGTCPARALGIMIHGS